LDENWRSAASHLQFRRLTSISDRVGDGQPLTQPIDTRPLIDQRIDLTFHRMHLIEDARQFGGSSLFVMTGAHPRTNPSYPFTVTSLLHAGPRSVLAQGQAVTVVITHGQNFHHRSAGGTRVDL
jgi:hypothetical protein